MSTDRTARTSLGVDPQMSALTPAATPLPAPLDLPPALPAAGPEAILLADGTTYRPAVPPEIDLSPATLSLAKRGLDILGASAALAMLAPFMLLIAALVRLDSKGPALFRQLRLGRGGRSFWCLKFRTMTTDAEQQMGQLESLNESAGGVLFKIRCDPRVTRLGRFLRRTSLDELPQLINVLRGEMSLVGPRPLSLRDSRRLEALEPHRFAHRLSVPQGVT